MMAGPVALRLLWAPPRFTEAKYSDELSSRDFARTSGSSFFDVREPLDWALLL
jgi:nucleoid-associated protein YgaU